MRRKTNDEYNWISGWLTALIAKHNTKKYPSKFYAELWTTKWCFLISNYKWIPDSKSLTALLLKGREK
jgi:hypothetical protein